MSNEHVIDFLSEKMRNHGKSHERDADEYSTINRLPDEIILQIISKLIDLKTLCFCYLVSRRLSSIVLQVGAISLAVSSLRPRVADKDTVGDVDNWFSLYGESFLSAIRFLNKFKGVKSLYIELLSSAIDNHSLLKWKVKFGHRIDSFIFLTPTSICDKDESYFNGNGFEEEANQQLISDMLKQNVTACLKCLNDVLMWYAMLLNIVKDLPMLEEVSITDSWKRGRLSLNGKKLKEVKEWVNSASETEMKHLEVPDVVSYGYIPVLKLSVSGYVMKGICCCVMEMKDYQGGYDFLKKSENGIEDKEEAAYSEAVMEILEKHRAMLFWHP